MSTRRFRIALRAEGALINAYYAQIDTMDDAVLVASVSQRLCELDGVFDAFKQMTAAIATALVEQVAGESVEQVIFEAAPEHERAGHG